MAQLCAFTLVPYRFSGLSVATSGVLYHCNSVWRDGVRTSLRRSDNNNVRCGLEVAGEAVTVAANK